MLLEAAEKAPWGGSGYIMAKSSRSICCLYGIADVEWRIREVGNQVRGAEQESGDELRPRKLVGLSFLEFLLLFVLDCKSQAWLCMMTPTSQ